MKTKTSPAFSYFLVALGAALLIYACVMQGWIAMRMPLWGDELDMLTPAFRNWRGHQSFWWQIGQYNAQPPGDNLMLRVMYRSGLLQWLREVSPELFWRLPYILLFGACSLITALCSWRWTGSVATGFVAFALTLMSPGLLEYGNVVRFYIWSAFFTAAMTWSFFHMVESPRGWRYYLFSIITTLGVCVHLVAAPAAYLLLAYAVAWLAYDVFRRPLSFLSHLRGLPRLFFGALPFIMYKVELKHWLFIPHPWKEADPWAMFKSLGLGPAITGPLVSNLPLYLSFELFHMFLGAILLKTIWHALRRNLAATLQGAFLGLYLVATPVALFYSAAQRNYGLTGRHFVFAAPVAIAAGIFLVKPLLRLRLPYVSALIGIVLCLFVARDAFREISVFASQRVITTPSRVTYPVLPWRNAYRLLPDRKQLVIVGAQPDRYGPSTDDGEFRAGLVFFYTDEFKPLHLSEKGSYNAASEPDQSVARSIEQKPGAFDYLVLDNPETAKKRFPKLPWKSFKCMTYRSGGVLSFCRT